MGLCRQQQHGWMDGNDMVGVKSGSVVFIVNSTVSFNETHETIWIRDTETEYIYIWFAICMPISLILDFKGGPFPLCLNPFLLFFFVCCNLGQVFINWSNNNHPLQFCHTHFSFHISKLIIIF